VKHLNNKFGMMLLASLLFLGVGAVGTNAQVKDDPFVKACEEAVDKVKRLDIENSSLKAQLDLANQRLVLKDEQIANKEEQVQFYKKASEKGDQIDRTHELMVQNLRQQIADDRLRINDLENENDSLRRSRTIRTIAGFGIGFGLGYYVKKQNF
jgi:predicted RNase H-like nuclease (RuvC/YqgF family)